MLLRSGALRLVPLVAASALALVTATAASAHAVLLSTTPTDGSAVAASPDRITLRFSEPVVTSLGSIRLFDADAGRRSTGSLSRPEPEIVEAPVDGRLGHGTYTVSWRVISADGHPVHGAFVFSVGHATGGLQPADVDVSTPEYVGDSFWIARFLSLLLVLATVGGSVSLAVCLRDASDRVRRRIAGSIAIGASLLVPLSLAGLVLEGSEASGYGVLRAARWDVVSEVLDTRFGQAWLARALIAVAVVVIALLVLRGLDPWAVALVSFALVPTLSLAGHAGVGGAVELVADLAHLGAAAVWTGGLAAIALALLSVHAEERWRLASRAVPRFSLLAFGSVALLIAAGLVSGYLEVRSWHGLWETTYGRLVLVKAGLLLGLLALGAYNRLVAVPRLRGGDVPGSVRRGFARAVSIELALMVVVIGLTASLVVQPPAKAQVATGGPVAMTQEIGPFELDLVVDPATTGTNQMHLTLFDGSGRPARVDEAEVSASYPAAGIGPLQLEAHPAGPGHFIVHSARLPFAGDWRFDVAVRRGDFDEWSTTAITSIRKAENE
jgi:copper transport protein